MTDKKDQKMPTEDRSIHVKVFSAYQNYYEGPASSVSAENDTGPFDVLSKHHNFITLVNKGEIIIRADGIEDKKLHIEKGVMHVRSDKITFFLDV